MIIRRTEEDDIPALARIVSENYSRSFAEYFVAECGCSFTTYAWKPHFYTATIEGRPVGCACYVASWISWGTYSLAWVNTSMNFRHRGIARALVTKCLDDVRSIGTLVTLSTSVPEFYARCWNFKELDSFIGNEGESYILMNLSLAKS